MAPMAIDVLDLNWRLLQGKEKPCTRRGWRMMHCNPGRARGDRCTHREKHGEGSRIVAIERNAPDDDLDPLDAEDKQKLAKAEWRRRSRMARQQREVVVAQLDEKIIEPGLDLQDEAAMEFGVIKFPQGFDDLVADLEEDFEIQGVASLLLTTQRPLLADLAAS